MNLVIGNTSQLFPYFKEYDENIIGISSRNIDFNEISNNNYDIVFLTFGEQRTFLEGNSDLFNLINVKYTLDIIEKIKYNCKRIVIYLTSELWNQYEGEIDINLPFFHNNSPYIKSKELLKFEIDRIRDRGEIDIRIIYPFNFNSPYRREGFLFSKIVKAIIEKTPIEVGNLDFYRDMITPRVVVENSFGCNSDVIVGSGVLTNIREFYSDLLLNFNMDYKEYVREDQNSYINTRQPYYLKTENKYNNLLRDTIYDIKQYSDRIS